MPVLFFFPRQLSNGRPRVFSSQFNGFVVIFFVDRWRDVGYNEHPDRFILSHIQNRSAISEDRGTFIINACAIVCWTSSLQVGSLW